MTVDYLELLKQIDSIIRELEHELSSTQDELQIKTLRHDISILRNVQKIISQRRAIPM